jgi:hypothetical protein
MIFTVVENSVFFSTLFALVAYVAASVVCFGARKKWWDISPFALTRVFAALILLPPVFALWIVLAALLPETWLGADAFSEAHIAPVHEWHLLSDLTARFDPFLASATILFLLSAAIFVSAMLFAIWKSKRLRPRRKKLRWSKQSPRAEGSKSVW